jgi:predicted MFS family arabinose efflux permease
VRRTARPWRHLLIDLSPLRRSRDLRYLVAGELVSQLGSQLTVVAVPFQVYALTHSSLDVGLVSLAQIVPLIAGALLGGSLADAVDRRLLLLIAELLMALCSAGLAINADAGVRLWPLFVLPALAAGFGTGAVAAMSAILPSLVGQSEIATVNSMFQALFQLGGVAGPAVAGLLLAGAGVRFVYWIDVASWGAALVAAAAIGPQRARRVPGHHHAPGLRSIAEGFGYLRGRQVLQGAYLIDINATVFGMPKAVFPALAATVFGGGASTLGFLYAAPGAGALLGAVTTGWVHRIRRQGRAVVLAVIVWGAAIAAFGVVRSLPIALVLLALAGWADVLSAVFRSTIIQLAAPDDLRGRLMGVQMAAVTAGPRMGDVEAGAVANAFGATTSVVSGGLACIVGALALARLLPDFRRQEAGSQGAPSDDQRHAGAPQHREVDR